MGHCWALCDGPSARVGCHQWPATCCVRISSIKKSKITILQNKMALNTDKDIILLPECLVYWSWWLELGSSAVDAGCSDRKVSLGSKLSILQICYFVLLDV